MQKDFFSYENKLFTPKPRSAPSFKKLFIVSSVFLSLSFFSVKLYDLSFSSYDLSSFFYKLSPPSLRFKKDGTQKLFSRVDERESHTLPLLVSLKGRDGPRLAKVSVSVYLDSQNLKEDFGEEIKNLENQLLFLLSGRPITRLSSKDFQDQIQKQLNLFLSRQMIQDLNIETELLNQTRSDL